ncbi:MAG: ATP-binding cassette domain-containing protein [Saprospiraceae bacterium]
MSVQISHITKKFGAQTAVNNLSFTAQPSQILGFLGPNGAGKTTTMKMITGYHTPDSGVIEVCGWDIQKHPRECKQALGYLPENNPLYKDMYIREYLMIFARLNGLFRPISRVEEVLQLTGLVKEQNKKIAELSKGYRQRVGLSQALLHDPKVLILDEPTSGLDPNQIIEIRDLIRNIGKEKTIIFSTHIMQEVRMLCDRVIIINNGNLVADDPIESFQDRFQDRQIVHVEFRAEPDIRILKNLEGIDSIKSESKTSYKLYSSSSQDLRDIIYNASVQNHWPLREIHRDRSSVEEVFTLLTRQDTK